MPRRTSPQSPPLSPRITAKRERPVVEAADKEIDDGPVAPPRPGNANGTVAFDGRHSTRVTASSPRLYSAKLSPLMKPLRSPGIHPLPAPGSTSRMTACTAPVSSVAPSAAPTASSPKAFESLFSQPEVRFQLEADRGRTSLLPRDVANLMLWALPTSIPIVECPKWAFLKNRSHCCGVTVIYCNGVSYDVLMNTGAGVAAAAASNASLSSSSSSSPAWSEAVCSATLSPLRRGCCFAHHNEVFHAPLWVPSQNDRLELDFFLRTSPPHRRAAGARPEASAPNEAPHARAEASSSSAGTATHETLPSAAGASTVRTHPQSVQRPSLLDIAKACATGAALPVTVSSLPPVAGCGGGTTAADATICHQDNSPGTLGPLGAHFTDREKLMEFALNTDAHETTLRELQFILEPPNDEAHLWKSCSRRSYVGDSHAALAAPGSATDHAQGSPIAVYGMDCEMVQLADGVAALARCTLVRLPSMEVVLDMLVKPEAEIVDYVTRFSGITPAMLDPVTTRLTDAQQALLGFFGGVDGDDKRTKGRRGGPTTTTFVVGHSLENDFKACKLIPHGIQILDTSHLFPHPAGPPFKNALRFLAQHYLKREIQRGEHDSVEDALIAAHLVDLKLTHGPHFGISSRTSILKMVPNTLLNYPTPSASGGTSTANPLTATPALHSTERTSSAPLSSHHHVNPAAESPAQPITVAMVDSPATLRMISGCGAHCVPIPSNTDDTTCKKAEKFLRKQCPADHCGDHESETDSSTSSRGAFLLWLQFRDHVISAAGVDAATGEEAVQLAVVQSLNDLVMRVVSAAPNKSLVLVVAANCRGGNGNRLSKAQGMVFGFIKDNSARGPSDAQNLGRECKAS